MLRIKMKNMIASTACHQNEKREAAEGRASADGGQQTPTPKPAVTEEQPAYSYAPESDFYAGVISGCFIL